MPNIDILVLAIVQGVTEFLPVSSSAHLILVPQFFCWPDQGLALDVAAHIGTLLAVLTYFWRDVVGLGQGLWQIAQRKRDPRGQLVGYLLVGSLPALVIGYILDRYFGDSLRNPAVIAVTLIVFALLLYAADKLGLTVRRLEHLNIGHVLLIGIFQCLVFVPGASRTGIAMTMTRFLGYERLDAARFSFLLSIPTIAAAGLFKGFQLLHSGTAGQLQAAVLMVVCSAVAGFLAIAFIMYWLRRAGMAPFVLYCLGLGLYLLYVVYRLPGLLCSG